jgi:hypothetical protein
MLAIFGRLTSGPSGVTETHVNSNRNNFPLNRFQMVRSTEPYLERIQSAHRFPALEGQGLMMGYGISLPYASFNATKPNRKTYAIELIEQGVE